MIILTQAIRAIKIIYPKSAMLYPHATPSAPVRIVCYPFEGSNIRKGVAATIVIRRPKKRRGSAN